MKLRFAALTLAATAVLAVAFGVFATAPASVASAEEDELGLDASVSGHPWLKQSIINCAAKTIGIRPHEVVAGLRHGASLKEIAWRNGVREPELKRGILDCERDHLARLVEAGRLSRAEAARILNFLTEHIDRIVNFHYDV